MSAIANYLWEAIAPKTTLDVVMATVLLVAWLLAIGQMTNSKLRKQSAKRAQLQKQKKFAFEKEERSTVDSARIFEGQFDEDSDVAV